MMKANIVQIKRFAVHDGDGIRTTVFFKGCPLRCLWCHKPETLLSGHRLAFYRGKCVSCGKCAQICRLHKFSDGIHTICAEKCVLCRKCVEVCPQGALEIFGEYVGTDEICSALLKDKSFYDESGGGITLSGGECLLQSGACREILKVMKQSGINTAVDTCGFVPRSAIDAVMPYTDTFLYDIKAIDEDTHIKCTGQSNKLILENLKYIDDCGKRIEIRIPYVPGYNSGEKSRITEYLKGFGNLVKVRVLPYHNYAGSKYEALGMKNTLPPKLPSDAETESFQSEINANLNLI